MRSIKRITVLLITLALAVVTAAAVTVAAAAENTPATAQRIEQYRPQLSFTPAAGWNNDPNGLVYDPDKGEYHMYYQHYPNGNVWGDMHWGHAVSRDLVHWEEKDIAIYPLFAGNDLYKADAVWDSGSLIEVKSINGNNPHLEGGAEHTPTGTIFSGSVVYVSEADAQRAYRGAGFYAIFTQPKSAEERWWDVNKLGETLNTDQRQTIAYSADGNFFAHETFREIIPVDYEGRETQYPADFRDPKVFWDDVLGEWMMVVGGGEVLQFASSDLLEWRYVGSTGLWGECPDLFALDTPNGDTGEQTWVLLLSPKNEMQSHLYNGTTAADYAYDNEYYILGTRDQNGLFVRGEGQTLQPLSFGIDSYAVQTFTGAPDGKRYGVSWAAGWNTVSEYAQTHGGGLRENWNGGMTLTFELTLQNINGRTVLAKTPVQGYESLRGAQPLYAGQAVTLGETNALQGVHASLAEADVTLYTDNAAARNITLSLATSDYERTDIVYDIKTQTLTVDRSASSLAAQNTSRYAVPYRMPLAADGEGKVRIRAWLDWGNLFIAGGRGEASANVAIFPSLYSNGMSLTADGNVTADVTVYALGGIWNNDAAQNAFDGFYVSAADETLYAGQTRTVLVGSPDPNFRASEVTAEAEGNAVTVAQRQDGSFAIAAVATGNATVTFAYGQHVKTVNVQVLSGTANSDLAFVTSYAGKWTRDNGIVGKASGDGFIYTAETYANFSLTATVTAREDNAVAFGIVFAAGEDFRTFYCANYDYNAQQVKLWMNGGESIAAYPLALRRGAPVTYALTVLNGEITVAVNGQTVIVASHGLYERGRVGLNVFNGAFAFNDIRLSSVYGAGETVCEQVGDEPFILRNQTDKTYLTANDYTVQEGVLTLSPSYVCTLTGGKAYGFTLLFESGRTQNFTLHAYAAVQIFDSYRVVNNGDGLQLAVSLGLAQLQSVWIDGKSVAYDFADSVLSFGADTVDALSDGDHTLRIVTDKGAAEFVFGYAFVPPPPVNKTGAVVSVIASVLVGCVLIAFAVYWITANRKRKGSKQA